MKNITAYEELRERLGCENKETIWENARLIYEQCYDKKYRKLFYNQQAFAEYLGVTKGRISQYRYAYEYYLQYQERIDLRHWTVEQVYYLYRYINSKIFIFFKWLQDEKGLSWEKISFKDTKKLIDEFCNHTVGNEYDNAYNITLTKYEEKIIQFYRNGTNEQRALIDAIIACSKK